MCSQATLSHLAIITIFADNGYSKKGEKKTEEKTRIPTANGLLIRNLFPLCFLVMITRPTIMAGRATSLTAIMGIAILVSKQTLLVTPLQFLPNTI